MSGLPTFFVNKVCGLNWRQGIGLVWTFFRRLGCPIISNATRFLNFSLGFKPNSILACENKKFTKSDKVVKVGWPWCLQPTNLSKWIYTILWGSSSGAQQSEHELFNLTIPLSSNLFYFTNVKCNTSHLHSNSRHTIITQKKFFSFFRLITSAKQPKNQLT